MYWKIFFSNGINDRGGIYHRFGQKRNMLGYAVFTHVPAEKATSDIHGLEKYVPTIIAVPKNVISAEVSMITSYSNEDTLGDNVVGDIANITAKKFIAGNFQEEEGVLEIVHLFKAVDLQGLEEYVSENYPVYA